MRRASSVRVGAFAVTKLTEGLSWADHFGASRLGTMKALGFEHRGAYHYLHPSEDPAAQAEHFLQAGGHELGPLDYAICDAEVSDGVPAGAGGVAARVRVFGETIAKHIGAARWLYCGGPFAKEFGLELAPAYEGHWLAAYVNNPAPYEVFGARTAAWQYTDGRNGPVPHVCPGIGACDLSIVL